MASPLAVASEAGSLSLHVPLQTRPSGRSDAPDDAQEPYADIEDGSVERRRSHEVAVAIAGLAPAASQPGARLSVQAALDLAYERWGRYWICSLVFLVLGMIGLLFWSEWIYDTHRADACDQPLAMMLRLLYIIIATHTFQNEISRHILRYSVARDGAQEPRRVLVFRRATIVATVLWPLGGAWMLSRARQCGSELKEAVLVVVLYYIVFTFLTLLLPVILIATFLFLIRRGVVHMPRSRNAAPADLIDRLPKVQFDAAQFDGGSKGDYSTECHICLELFDAVRQITRTTCAAGKNGHVFHTECLRGWLECARTCPICRTDLTITTAASTGDATIDELASGAPRSTADILI